MCQRLVKWFNHMVLTLLFLLKQVDLVQTYLQLLDEHIPIYLEQSNIIHQNKGMNEKQKLVYILEMR